MHILLSILKVIGIILLVILAILLAVLLLVLFVPFCYRVRFVKEDAVQTLECRLTWLFRFLHVSFVREGSDNRYSIRVLGFTVKKSEPAQSTPSSVSEKSVPDRPPEERKSVKHSGTSADDSAEDSTEDSAELQQLEMHAEDLTEQSSCDRQEESVCHISHESEVNSEDGLSDQRSDSTFRKSYRKTDAEAPKRNSDGDSAKSDKRSLIDFLYQFLDKMPDLIQRILEFVIDLLCRLIHVPFDLYDGITDRSDRIAAKIDALMKRVRPFLNDETRSAVLHIIRSIRKLISMCGPRKLSGYIRFGTGDPDMTGKLTGLCFVLFEAIGVDYRNYEIEPVFVESTVQTDTEAVGRIFSFQVLGVLIGLLLDKNVRRLIAVIRNPNGEEKKSRKKRKSKAGKKPKRRSGKSGK